MKTVLIYLISFIILSINLKAELDSCNGSLERTIPASYEVKSAFEVESLVPMFFTGGYHFAICYRYSKFRFRASVINGGNYNADLQAVSGIKDAFERYYTTSPGLFAGYNIWKNLEIYSYYERHKFEVEQMKTHEKQNIVSNDFGISVSYQFFIGNYFYIQPGVHSYFRAEKSVKYSNNQTYSIPTFELSPVLRLGFRLWKQH